MDDVNGQNLRYMIMDVTSKDMIAKIFTPYHVESQKQLSVIDYSPRIKISSVVLTLKPLT